MASDPRPKRSTEAPSPGTAVRAGTPGSEFRTEVRICEPSGEPGGGEYRRNPIIDGTRPEKIVRCPVGMTLAKSPAVDGFLNLFIIEPSTDSGVTGPRCHYLNQAR